MVIGVADETTRGSMLSAAAVRERGWTAGWITRSSASRICSRTTRITARPRPCGCMPSRASRRRNSLLHGWRPMSGRSAAWQVPPRRLARRQTTCYENKSLRASVSEEFLIDALEVIEREQSLKHSTLARLRAFVEAHWRDDGSTR